MLYGTEEHSEQQKSQCSGIMLGVVKKNWDKDHPGMVQVELLMGEDGKETTYWIPVMQPYSGKGFGTYFLPEVNTEVVVGFLMGEMDCPVLLGCLWNKVDTLPANTANDKNSIKSIRTKGGHEIIFDETKDKEKIEIKTAGNMDVCLSDKEKVITISDDKGENLLKIDGKNGVITLEAKKKIVLKAGNVEMLTLDGSGKKATLQTNNINVDAKQNLNIKGQMAKLQSNTLELKAQGTLKAQASAAMQLKGAILKLN